MYAILVMRCISFDSYIKPQLGHEVQYNRIVVYLLIPTSNHNCRILRHLQEVVVYLLIPTSNHNSLMLAKYVWVLYIFWFLHQTTTPPCLALSSWCCISFDSYIKPQQGLAVHCFHHSCISFDSYIKPQRWHWLYRCC